MSGEEVHGLVKFVLFAVDGQSQNQIKSNFFALGLRYLHLDIAKPLSSFTI